MKNFTKLSISIATCFVAFTGLAQNGDLTMTDFTYPDPAAPDTVYSNNPIDVPFTFDILSGSVQAGDTIFLGISIGGTEVDNIGLPLAQAYSTGAQSLVRLDFNPGTVVTGTSRFCYYAKHDSGTDPNVANDSTCKNVVFSNTAAPADHGATAITNPLPNATIDLNDGTLPMNLTITNFGNLNYPAGARVDYEVTICGGTPQAFTGTLGTAMPAGGTTDRSTTINLPSVGGACQLCVKSNLTGDIDGSNDEFCIPVNVVDPVGVNYYNEAGNNVFYGVDNKKLVVNLNNVAKYNNIQLVVTNMTGQVVKSMEINTSNAASTVIPFEAIAGIYFVNITADGETIASKKFATK